MLCKSIVEFQKELSNLFEQSKATGFFIICSNQSEQEAFKQRFLDACKKKETSLQCLQKTAPQMEQGFLEQELNSLSLFATPKVLVIHQAEKLLKKDLLLISSYLKKPQASLLILLLSCQKSQHTLLKKTLACDLLILDATLEKPWEKKTRLCQETLAFFQSQKIQISSETALFFIEHVGEDSLNRESEKNKLLLFAKDKGSLNKEDIVHVCTSIDHVNTWALGDAILEKNAKKALSTLSSLLDEGCSEHSIVAQLRGQIQNAYQLFSMIQSSYSQDLISKSFPYMKGKLLEKKKQQMRLCSDAFFQKLLEYLFQAELKIKTQSDLNCLLETLVVKMVTA